MNGIKILWIVSIGFIGIIGCKQAAKNVNSETESSNEYAAPLFTLLDSSQTGVTFSNTLTENLVVNYFNYEDLYIGGGIAADDFNNDGLTDLFFAGTMIDNQLYINRGNLKFVDSTAHSGLADHAGFSTGVTAVDINQDGWMDIHLMQSGLEVPGERKDLLYINNHDLTFTERASEFGLSDIGFGIQTVFFDYDNDYDLDAFVINQPANADIANTIIILDTFTYFESDHLYENIGNGTFADVTKMAGVEDKAFGLSACPIDFNGDGWLDLYVANDYIKPDYLYINNKNGTFTNRLDDYIKHICWTSMGSAFQDYNNDGLFDFFIVDMLPDDNYRQKIHRSGISFESFWKVVEYGYSYQYTRNALQLNNGNGTFSEISNLAGVSKTDWSWAPLLQDFDNDGWKDLFITNGFRRDVTHQDYVRYTTDSLKKVMDLNNVTDINNILRHIPDDVVPDYMYRNKGDLTFEDVTAAWDMKHLSWSTGAVHVDLDNDGDLEIVTSNLDLTAFIYRNNSRELNRNNYIQFKLAGPEKNISGICTQIAIHSSSGVQTQWYVPNTGFLSSVENKIHFGLGKDSIVDLVEVKWTDGKMTRLQNVEINQLIEVRYSDAVLTQKNSLYDNPVLFQEITAQSGIQFIHRENDFVDFKREPLLPMKYSVSGPCLAVGDVNKDGLNDFYIGGAVNQSGAIYTQTSAGTFAVTTQPAFMMDSAYEDVSAILFDCDKDSDPDLYVVSGGYEYDAGSAFYQDRLYLNDGKGNFKRDKNALPLITASGSCVEAADFDRDGDLDLFVGGRIVPGRYPESPRSYILKNDGGKFSDVTSSVSSELQTPGLVCGASWSDIDQDGDVDLIVTGQWMNISVYRNENGKLHNFTSGSGLENAFGWWNCIEASDLDKDGDEDFVAGNLGLNTRIKASPDKPTCVYYNDFDGNGSLDAVMCYYNGDTSWPVHSRDLLLDQIRELRKKYTRFAPFARSTIYDIFTKSQMKNVKQLTASIFETCWIENLGHGKFTIHLLPLRAQFAPTNAILCNDFNADGYNDILIAGNNYGIENETGRYDAGTGLLLAGNGKGVFSPVPIIESGFFADRDVRSLAWLKSNSTFNSFILVGNNNASPQLFEWVKPQNNP